MDNRWVNFQRLLDTYADSSRHLSVRHPKALPLKVPMVQKDSYNFSDLLAMARLSLGFDVPRTTAEYWVEVAFSVHHRKRSIEVDGRGLQDWALYLALWNSLPRSSVNYEYKKAKGMF